MERLTGKQPGQLVYISAATFPVQWPKLKTVTIQPMAERNSSWVWAGAEKLGQQGPAPTGTTQGSHPDDGPVIVRPEPRHQGNAGCLLVGRAGGILPSRPGAPDPGPVPFSNLLGGWGPVSWEVISHKHDLHPHRRQRWWHPGKGWLSCLPSSTDGSALSLSSHRAQQPPEGAHACRTAAGAAWALRRPCRSTAALASASLLPASPPGTGPERKVSRGRVAPPRPCRGHKARHCPCAAPVAAAGPGRQKPLHGG